MREIKFRAWDRCYKRMHLNVELGIHEDPDEWIDFGTVLGLGRFEVMQYTGLKDENGREIYEGDIVCLHVDGTERHFEAAVETVIRKVKCHPSFADEYAEVEITGVVFKWNGFELFPCRSYRGLSDLQRMEVIGNIYENPELLEMAE